MVSDNLLSFIKLLLFVPQYVHLWRRFRWKLYISLFLGFVCVCPCPKRSSVLHFSWCDKTLIDAETVFCRYSICLMFYDIEREIPCIQSCFSSETGYMKERWSQDQSYLLGTFFHASLLPHNKETYFKKLWGWCSYSFLLSFIIYPGIFKICRFASESILCI